MFCLLISIIVRAVRIIVQMDLKSMLDKVTEVIRYSEKVVIISSEKAACMKHLMELKDKDNSKEWASLEDPCTKLWQFISTACFSIIIQLYAIPSHYFTL